MMDWQSIVKTVAPWIGTALGGPLGGMAVTAAANALGISDKTIEAVKTAITGATPEQILALKNADQSFALQMQDLGFKNLQAMEQMAAGDRASAREREIKTGDSWTPRILALIVVAGWLVIQYFLFNHIVPSEMRELIARMLGTLDASLTLVLGYYFGTSSGSAAKNEMIDRLAQNKGAA